MKNRFSIFLFVTATFVCNGLYAMNSEGSSNTNVLPRQPVFGSAEEVVLCDLLSANKTFIAQNSADKKNFYVTPINSIEDLNAVPKELGVDYRITKEDTEESCSCLKGIALDSDHVRSQIFAIKDGLSVIGIATLIITPFKYLSQKKFLRLEDNRLVFKSIREILGINNPSTFIIDAGWFHLLPEYRSKKLGYETVHQVLIPFIERLIKGPYKDQKLLIMCCAKGCADIKTKNLIHENMQAQLNTESDIKIEMPSDLLNLLGKVNPQSTFTLRMAQKLNFELLPVYGFSFGPVFVKGNKDSLLQ